MADHIYSDDEGSVLTASGGVTQEANTDLNIKKYDFRHPKLVSKEIMRALHKIHNQFARNIKRIFTNELNLKVEVTLEEIEQVIFAEFLNSIQPPTALFLFNIEELGEWAVLQMDPAFCVSFVEQQSGGRSIQLGEARSLTRIEERVIGRTVDKIFKELTHIWSSHINMTILHHVYESKPANIRTISSHIPGITVTFTLKVEQVEVPFSVCYPYALLKEQMMNSFGNLNTNTQKETLSTGQRLHFKNEMKQVNVQAKAMLGSTKIPIQKLLDLGEGDLIKLNQRIDEPLQIQVNNKLKMHGFPGMKSGNRAIKIFDILKNDN